MFDRRKQVQSRFSELKIQEQILQACTQSNVANHAHLHFDKLYVPIYEHATHWTASLCIVQMLQYIDIH